MAAGNFKDALRLAGVGSASVGDQIGVVLMKDRGTEQENLRVWGEGRSSAAEQRRREAARISVILHREERPVWRLLFAAAFICVLAGLVYGVRQATQVKGAGNRGVLTVESDPPGASLWLNDRLQGATPVKLKISPGVYVLRLEKNKHDSVTQRLSVEPGRKTALLRVKMPVPATGSIQVDLAPKGSEVLLDGYMVGHTPLKLTDIQVGTYELRVRRPNFTPYAATVTVLPDETAVLSGFALEDKLLKALHNSVNSDPQGVANYTQLARYLFSLDRLEEAAEWFARGLDAAAKPLEFPKEMAEEFRQNERQQRQDDYKKLLSDIKTHRAWPGKDTRVFREALDVMQLKLAKTNVADFQWAEPAIRNLLAEKRLAEAEQMALRHLELVKQQRAEAEKNADKIPPVPVQGHILLTEVRMHMRNRMGALAAANEFLKLAELSPQELRQMGNQLYSQSGNFTGEDRTLLLGKAEQVMQRAFDSVKGDKNMEAQCLFELGNILRLQGRAEEAVRHYRPAVEATKFPEAKEDRSLSLASAMVEAGLKVEAIALYRELLKSSRASVQASARAGLNLAESGVQ